MARTFTDITQEECESCFPALMENSARHFSIAERLSEMREYGVAISHLVLSAEELIKAWILFFDSLGLSFRKVKGIQRLFKRHSVKHGFASVFFFMGFVMKFFIESFAKIREQPELLKQLKSKESSFFINLKSEASSLMNQGFVGFEWWGKADFLKQRGFYVDYDDQLLTPSSLAKEDYDTAYQIVSELQKKQVELINFMRKGTQKDLEQFAAQIKDDGIYKLVEQLITL